MALGERLLQARKEAGLSQRKLCGDVITRNMLSQIEHGAARPSMDTLRYLAERLGKPVSFFLEEDVVLSPNQNRMEQAREAFHSGNYEQAGILLRGFQHPDRTLEWEWNALSFEVMLASAEQAVKAEKIPYARQLLEEAAAFEQGDSLRKRRRLLLLGKLPGAELTKLVQELPSLDEELLLRAQEALNRKDAQRAECLLAAAEDRESPGWNLLQGRVLVLQNRWKEAADCLQLAEGTNPQICYRLLEVCFRELGDYQKAYLYACKQR